MTTSLVAMEHLETRRLLALIGPDFTYGDRGLAPESASSSFIGFHSGERPVLLSYVGGEYRLERRLENGQFDSTYAFPRITQELAIRAAMDGQGRVIVLKQAFEPESSPVVLSRYSANGSLETGYTASLAAPGSHNGLPLIYYQPWHMAVDTQGRALVLSASGYNSDPDQQYVLISIDRVLPDGQIDTTFGDHGRVWVVDSLSTQTGSVELFVQPSGRILVSRGNPKGATIVDAFTDAGQVDTEYGENGSIALLGTEGGMRPAIALDSTGRMRVFVANRGSVAGYCYSPDGVRDVGFCATISPPRVHNPIGAYVSSIRVDSLGRVTGTSGNAVFRFAADGSIDTDFDGDGIARVDDDRTSILAVTDDRIYVQTALGSTRGIAALIEEPSVFLNLVTGVLQISGTSGNDVVAINSTVDGFRVNFNDDVFTFDDGDLKSISFVCGDGADNFESRISTGGTALLGRGDDAFSAAASEDWTVWGGYGNDTVYTGGGDDRVYPELGNDEVFTHTGNDTICDTGGNNRIEGGEDDDLVRCAEGNNTIFGGGGRDTLRGGSGDDLIEGQGGRDRIFGNDGNDTLSGGGNVDRLSGGPGSDLLTGGVGDDIFYDPRPPDDTTTVDTLLGGAGVDRGLFDDEDDAFEIETILDELT